MALKNHEETKIQNEIMLELSKYGIPIRQQSGIFFTEYGTRIKIGINGMSDILFIKSDGTPYWLEVKTVKGKPSKDQLKFLEIMKQNNVKGGIVRSVEDALKLIK
jgi:hypothetical protein